MSRSRAVAVGLAAVALVIGTRRYLVSAMAPSPENRPTITLTAASGATIEFQTQNGQTIGDMPPQASQIPHLVLQRNGALTSPQERTLRLDVSGLDVPPGGITLTLTLETEHADPDGGIDGAPIRVWEETRVLTIPTPSAWSDTTVPFIHTFADVTEANGVPAPTPTDYLRVTLSINEADPGKALVILTEEHALLLEAQAVVNLPSVPEAAEGAAPDVLTVAFCDMVPFINTATDGQQRLHRADVARYVLEDLVPQMVETFRIETEDWGFPWHAEWSSFRPEDGDQLGVVLGDGETWYHGITPGAAHAGISLNVSRDIRDTTYRTLTDRLMSSFTHELFHNIQRDLALHYGGHGDVAGVEGLWYFFDEGTASAVTSTRSASIELDSASGQSHYLLNVNRYLGDAASPGALNTPVAETTLYASALYWRFLIDQCGGMDVARETLIALYTGTIVDIRTSRDIVTALPRVMDQGIGGASCPFNTYRESLEAFARAVYALTLQNGRCSTIDQTDECGLYDPDGLYHRPQTGKIIFTGAPVTYDAALQPQPAGIPNSFGMDFVEVDLAQTANGQSLTIELLATPGSVAQFSAQVWELTVDSSRVSASGNPRTMQPDAEGRLPASAVIDSRPGQQIAILVTRIDAEEQVDSAGAYTLIITSQVQ